MISLLGRRAGEMEVVAFARSSERREGSGVPRESLRESALR